MKLADVKEVCKELNLECKQHNCGTEWFVYAPNSSSWISCYYPSFDEAVIYHSGLPVTNNKDEYMEGLKIKLKQLKEESIKERIDSLEKDFE